MTWRLSLSQLKENGKAELMAGFNDPFEHTIVTICYQDLSGLPLYTINYNDEKKDVITATNIVDVIENVNEEYSVVLVP